MNSSHRFNRTGPMSLFILSSMAFFMIYGCTSTREISELEASSISRFVVIDNVCAWPNIMMLPNGTIAAVIHNTPSHGQMEGSVECWVSDNGEFWEMRGMPVQNDPNTVRMNVAAGLANNGDLLVITSGWTNEQQPGQPKRGNFRDGHIPVAVTRSNDNGATWTQFEGFPEPEEGWSRFVPFGDIVIGDDGLLHASAYTRGSPNDPNSASRYDRRRQSWFFSSRDDGKTWEKTSMIGPDHNETTLLYLGEQKWLAGARINIPNSIDLFYSNDNGKTWKDPQRVTGPRQMPGNLYRLNDGRVLFTYGNREFKEGNRGILAKLSNDEGKTWSSPIQIAQLDGDLGYPSSVQRADGKIVTAYYSSLIDNHSRYHMGVAIWDPPEN